MKILSVVDSFKGSLSSKELSKIFEAFYTHLNIDIKSIIISDGGEGFLDAIESSISTNKVRVETVGPLGKIQFSTYLIKDDIAYIELSQAIGINQIDTSNQNPLYTSSYGLGVIIKHAIREKKVKSIVLGIGGSSTNDGGAGMLQAMGLKFYKNKKMITKHMNGELIGDFDYIDTSDLFGLIKNVEFIVASDVDNPLLGKQGCSMVYAPQKGANKAMIDVLEINMNQYATHVENALNKAFRDIAGAGAAGGIGFASLAFLNAKMIHGIDFMIEQLNIESSIKNADVVIVGEGKIDVQTLYGKAPYGIAKLAKKYHKKVIAVCGICAFDFHSEFIDEVYAIVPRIATKEASLDNPTASLIKLLDTMTLN
jgi:glycerate kinase